ncbi:transcriptional activator of glycolytic enzymes-domain-containing protein [Scheffersomyces amazonensis]|uniref:transcriptional activator of glycolytic enzymes-domain-containing protein n=1 Tax=Scheffersomyces amazonensis TaxID=1078765 RepID=UPI00315D8F1F
MDTISQPVDKLDHLTATSMLSTSGNQQSPIRNVEEQTYGRLGLERLEENLQKLENDKVNALSEEVAYIRQLVEFQNNKIERLTTIINEFVGNKSQEAILNSLGSVQDNVLGDHDHHHDHHHDHDHDQVNEVQEQAQNQVDQQVLGSHGDITGQTSLDGNMDPQLHQVAVAAAAVRQAQEQQGKNKKSHKRKIGAISGGNGNNGGNGPGNSGGNGSGGSVNGDPGSNKRPNIVVDFLHNPTSVKEIYDEFTKGFRGQPPLCQMDAKYGKQEWRGDSRSKESKRFQRRKKLCDAIERGTIKYGKPPQDIISYIEEFRGEKSLTWVMNGNLPSDLLS